MSELWESGDSSMDNSNSESENDEVKTCSNTSMCDLYYYKC